MKLGFLLSRITKIIYLPIVTLFGVFILFLNQSPQFLPSINFFSLTPKYGIITMFSSNHVCEAIHSCRTYANIPELYNRTISIIGFYASDVTEADLKTYRKNCPVVQLRPFTVSQYPEYFKDLKNYRFKFPTVANVLPEFSTILYVDSSIRLHPVKGGTLTDHFKSMETQFAPTGIRLLYQSWHRNFPATHPDMYAFFNVTEQQMKDTFQAASGLYFLNNSPQGWKIMNKLVQCALESKCMSPQGAIQKCDYSMLTKNEKAVCHRFDQSALNMRLIELYGTNKSLYYRGSDMMRIVQMTECNL